MPDISNHIKTRLEENVIIADLADGGIYTKRVDRNATPAAFNEQPPNLPRRSVSVVGGLKTSEKIPGLETSILTLWIRWNDDDTETALARQLAIASRAEIDQQVVGVGSNCGMVEYIDEFEQPDPWLKGGRMNYVRFRVAGLAAT